MKMKKIMAGLTAGLLAVATWVSPFAISAQEALAGHVEIGQTPKNVILLIPDGMGTSDMMAYRQYKDGGYKAVAGRTAMDEFVVGSMITTPEEDLAEGGSTITDSAAAGTAMATGEKTYGGAIGVDNDGSDLENISEVASANGRSVGIVATSDVFHATPASFHSHVESRKDYEGMLKEMIEQLTANGELSFDVLLGGGQQYFKTEEADHTQLFKDNGYTYVETADELAAVDSDKLLGLFAPDALPYHFDTVDEAIPSLAEMTTAAINTLNKNEAGFFLMVEASQIDWANHANDLTGMVSEIAGYEEAFQAAIDFAKEDGETLVIAAADHDTGGFSISGKQGDNDNQQFIIDPVLGMKHSPNLLASLIEESGDVEGTLTENVEWKFTNEEISAMEDALTMGEGAKDKIVATLTQAVNVRANAGWSTGEHTGGDVNFYAYGPGFDYFIGLNENTDVAKIVKFFITGQMVENAATEESQKNTAVEGETSVEESALEGESSVAGESSAEGETTLEETTAEAA